ncbi:MAG: hypothetical protein ACYSTS_11310 [Planctomycetota bacterium]|jgi:hemerythrin-like domain-containing protein
MSSLIEEFKKEHSGIVNELKEVKKYGILTKEAQAKLVYVKSILNEHLKKEEEKLYPFLYKVAEQDEKLNKVLKFSTNDLEKVSIGVSAFFDKYSKGVLDTILMEEFGNIYTVLCERFVYEEFLLYDEYEELNKL